MSTAGDNLIKLLNEAPTLVEVGRILMPIVDTDLLDELLERADELKTDRLPAGKPRRPEMN